MQKPIVVVGSINLDLVVGADRIPQVGETIIGNSFNTFCGGKGGNQAVAAAKLGYPVSMVGNVGQDAFGTQLRNGLERRRRGYDLCEYSGRVVGRCVDHDRAKRREQHRGRARCQWPPHVQKCWRRRRPILERAGFLLAQLEIPLETVEYLAQFAERHYIPLMLDPAPARELSEALLRRVSWITPNETETEELLKTRLENGDQDSYAAADHLLARGAKNVLLKLGSRGCVIAQA